MCKPWTCHEQVMNMAWTSSEQVKSKSWTSHEQIITSSGKVVNKSLIWADQVLKNCEQVVDKYCSLEIFLNENQEDFENLWSTHE